MDIENIKATVPAMADMRLRRAILPASFLLLVVIYAHSCVPKPITDLRIVEVRRVPASAWPDADLREALMRRDEVAWKLSFAGDANWIREVRQHELNSYATVVRCDERDYGIDSFGPYVGNVAATYYSDGFAGFRPTSGSLRYDIYLPEASTYRSEADFNAPMPTFDLSKQRLLLCIRIAGGAMHGAYNRSNEVKVEVGISR